MKNIKFFNQKGQALVTLLFFTLIGIAIATAAITLTLSSIISSSKFKGGVLTFAEAESGAENGYLMLLRNPSYSGETMTINNTPVTITVTGINPIVITSTATAGSFVRKVQIQVQYINGQYSVQSWKEIF